MIIIHLARKPLVSGGTVKNVLLLATGGLNIEDCRIGTLDPGNRSGGHRDFTLEGYQRPGTTMFQDKTDWKMSQAGRWPANLILEHLPGCQCIGTKEVGKGERKKATSGTGTSQPFNCDKGWHKHSMTLCQTAPHSYGTETLAAWVCLPGCPVAELDLQSGDRKATLTGRSDPTGKHEHLAKISPPNWFGQGNSKLGMVYADTGGASRYFLTVQLLSTED